jgi:DNA-binding beta-propeller fold protein YncE
MYRKMVGMQARKRVIWAIDAKTGEVKGRLVLDDRKRTEEVRPLQPRELVADDATNTVYISGIGKESVIWVVDGENIKLKTAIQNTGKMSTGLALDSKGKRLYTTNADGELITIDTADNKILSRKKLLTKPQTGMRADVLSNGSTASNTLPPTFS